VRRCTISSLIHTTAHRKEHTHVQVLRKPIDQLDKAAIAAQELVANGLQDRGITADMLADLMLMGDDSLFGEPDGCDGKCDTCTLHGTVH
jgi:hypothetical protein